MSDIGARLRAAREARGISLNDIAEKTKISKGSLEALERGDVSRLPGGIFVRAFVRAYAAEVGLDPEQAVRAFVAEQGDQVEAPVVAARLPDGDAGFETNQRVARVLLRIVLISVSLAGAILYFTLRQKTAPAAQDVAPPAVNAAAPAATSQAAAPAQVPSQPAADAQPRTAAAIEVPAGQAGAVRAADTQLSLAVDAKAACWTDIIVDGKRALSRTLQPGERVTLEASDSLVIRVGDAGAFAFTLNGREGKPLGAAGEVRTVTITKETAATFLR